MCDLVDIYWEVTKLQNSAEQQFEQNFSFPNGITQTGNNLINSWWIKHCVFRKICAVFINYDWHEHQSEKLKPVSYEASSSMSSEDFLLCVEQCWARGHTAKSYCSEGLIVTLCGTDTSHSSTQGYRDWLLDQSNPVSNCAPGHPSPKPHIPSISKLMGLPRQNHVSLKISKWWEKQGHCTAV